MNSHPENQIKDLFDCLWSVYAGLNPKVMDIRGLFEARGESVVNDHVAFRTYACATLGLDRLSAEFERLGYSRIETYRFEQKHLNARYYEPPVKGLPKCFVSELQVNALSDRAQQIIRQYVAQIDQQVLNTPYFCASGRPWPVPTWAEYEQLRGESEYAAWMLVFGHVPNHFTVRVNELNTLKSLGAVNDLVEQAGYKLNEAGGKIKGSRDVGLEQSSTLAGECGYQFADGEQAIPSVFYEFALRYPTNDGQLFEGFIEANADKIFESTDMRR